MANDSFNCHTGCLLHCRSSNDCWISVANQNADFVAHLKNAAGVNLSFEGLKIMMPFWFVVKFVLGVVK